MIAQLTAPDYVILFGYLAVVVGLGSWLGRGQSSLSDYFLAKRSTHWIVACVSVIATDLSAISYMGMPAYLYQNDLKFIVGNVFMPIALLLVVILFLPVFHHMRVFTVYEYLERRFHPLARTITAVLFLFQRGVWLAAAIYIPSLALSTFSGLPLVACILLIGALTTVFTTLGGMKAVVWTDFLQFIVMMGGLILMICVQLRSFGWDVGAVWDRAGSMTAPESGLPHTTCVDWSFNLTTEATVWSLAFFYIVYTLGTYGTDQVVVQRYFTMKTLKEQVKSVLGSGILTLSVVFLLAAQGLLLVVYYADHPDIAAGLTKADGVVPHFVVEVLPAGVRGLIFAAIFSATISSVSSGLNSFATVGVMDLYRRLGKGSLASESHSFRVAKVCTLLCGVLATLAALWISRSETTILQNLVTQASKFIGPISGIFLLGVLTKRGNLVGVCAGAGFGLLVAFLDEITALLSYVRSAVFDGGAVTLEVNWLWTAPLGCVVTFLTGYLVSVLIPYRGKSDPGSPPDSSAVVLPESEPDARDGV